MTRDLRRRPRPTPRRRLLEAAARLLDEEGPDALTARRLASAAGTSTMAVYTHFGGMPALVRRGRRRGLHPARRARRRRRAAPTTRSPTCGGWPCAYRDNALDNPHLYAVMFGAQSLGASRRRGRHGGRVRQLRPDRDRQSRRAIDAGALRARRPRRVAAPVLDRPARLRDARARAACTTSSTTPSAPCCGRCSPTCWPGLAAPALASLGSPCSRSAAWA